MPNVPSSKLVYDGTNIDVRLGDRVQWRGWFWRKKRGYVSYLPGISPPHSELEYDDVRQWAMTDENGTVWPILYDPEHFPPPKDIVFLGRGTERPIQPTDELN